MPFFIAALWGALIPMLGSFVGRILVSLGIGYVTYTGIDTAITFAKNAFLSGLSGLPANAVAMAGVLKIGVCVSMLLSAVTARFVMQGLVAGAVKRQVLK